MGASIIDLVKQHRTYLKSWSHLDEVLLQNVVERRVKLLSDVFDYQGATEGQSIFEVRAEVFVVQWRQLNMY